MYQIGRLRWHHAAIRHCHYNDVAIHILFQKRFHFFIIIIIICLCWMDFVLWFSCEMKIILMFWCVLRIEIACIRYYFLTVCVALLSCSHTKILIIVELPFSFFFLKNSDWHFISVLMVMYIFFSLHSQHFCHWIIFPAFCALHLRFVRIFFWIFFHRLCFKTYITLKLMSSIAFHLLQHVIRHTHSLLSAHEQVFITTKCFNGIITATMITHTINSKYTGCANSDSVSLMVLHIWDADKKPTYENGATRSTLTHTNINNRKAGKKKVWCIGLCFFSFPYTAEDMVSTCSRKQHRQQHFVDLKFSLRYRAMSIMYKQFELHKPYIHFSLSGWAAWVHITWQPKMWKMVL